MKYVLLLILGLSFHASAESTESGEWTGRDLNAYLSNLIFPRGVSDNKSAVVRGDHCSAYISRQRRIIEIFLDGIRVQVAAEAGSRMMQNPPYKVSIQNEESSPNDTYRMNFARTYTKDEWVYIEKHKGVLTEITIAIDGWQISCRQARPVPW